MRRSVEPYAARIVKLAGCGLLDCVLDRDPEVLAPALAIGAEWLGEAHPILKCLSLGVAVHHGALPTPFRKEMERLLRDGVLKITVSSPTLAQWLNLTATAVIMHSLHRSRDVIPTSEFKNVIGRAGRAFINIEGVVLFPIFDRHAYRRAQWAELIGNVSEHSLKSGLRRLVITLLVRLKKSLDVQDLSELQEYVLNNTAAWDFPKIAGEADEARDAAARNWEQFITVLDTAILSLLGDQEMNADEIAAHLDEVLQSSLWQRRLERRNAKVQELVKTSIEARARLIWNQSTTQQRRGYFLAGVGLQTGQQLDAVAAAANDLLIAANGAILGSESEQAIEAITGLAETVFTITPFVPDFFPDNWRDVLRCWLMGQPLAEVVADNPSNVLRFVENGLIYKLPWGVEAIKVRAQANGDTIDDDGIFTIDDFETGLAVPAIETGTLNRSAAILMQAGFTSRLAAIKDMPSKRLARPASAILRATADGPRPFAGSRCRRTRPLAASDRPARPLEQPRVARDGPPPNPRAQGIPRRRRRKRRFLCPPGAGAAGHPLRAAGESQGRYPAVAAQGRYDLMGGMICSQRISLTGGPSSSQESASRNGKSGLPVPTRSRSSIVNWAANSVPPPDRAGSRIRTARVAVQGAAAEEHLASLVTDNLRALDGRDLMPRSVHGAGGSRRKRTILAGIETSRLLALTPDCPHSRTRAAPTPYDAPQGPPAPPAGAGSSSAAARRCTATSSPRSRRDS